MKINWNPKLSDLKKSYEKSFANDFLGKLVGLTVGLPLSVALAPITVPIGLISAVATGTSKTDRMTDAFSIPISCVKHLVAAPVYAVMHPYNTVVGLRNGYQKYQTSKKESNEIELKVKVVTNQYRIENKNFTFRVVTNCQSRIEKQKFDLLKDGDAKKLRELIKSTVMPGTDVINQEKLNKIGINIF